MGFFRSISRVLKGVAAVAAVATGNPILAATLVASEFKGPVGQAANVALLANGLATAGGSLAGYNTGGSALDRLAGVNASKFSGSVAGSLGVSADKLSAFGNTASRVAQVGGLAATGASLVTGNAIDVGTAAQGIQAFSSGALPSTGYTDTAPTSAQTGGRVVGGSVATPLDSAETKYNQFGGSFAKFGAYRA